MLRIKITHTAALSADVATGREIHVGDLQSLSGFFRSSIGSSTPPGVFSALGAAMVLFAMRDHGGREPSRIAYNASKVIDALYPVTEDPDAAKAFEAGSAAIEEHLFEHRGETLEDQLNAAWEFLAEMAPRWGLAVDGPE
jgi:hypothetical protein